MADDHFTKESEGRVGSIETVEDARKAHHLASADPEIDGLLTGPAHEAKYGLERADQSAALWRAAGVHPTENRALVGKEDGAENLASIETADAAAAPENASAPRASDKS